MTKRNTPEYDLGYRQGRAAAERAARTRDHTDLVERAFIALLPMLDCKTVLQDNTGKVLQSPAERSTFLWHLAQLAVDHRPRGVTARRRSSISII